MGLLPPPPLAILIKWRIAKKNHSPIELKLNCLPTMQEGAYPHPLRMLQPCPLFILYPKFTLYLQPCTRWKTSVFYVPTNNYYREEELSYQSQVDKVIRLWSEAGRESIAFAHALLYCMYRIHTNWSMYIALCILCIMHPWASEVVLSNYSTL